MKPFRAKVLDTFINREHTHDGDTERDPIGAQSAVPRPVVAHNGNQITLNVGEVHTNGLRGPPPNRHQRRKNKKFNRMLSKRLEKDGTPASVEVLPDGGIHVSVKAEQQDKKE